MNTEGNQQHAVGTTLEIDNQGKDAWYKEIQYPLSGASHSSLCLGERGEMPESDYHQTHTGFTTETIPNYCIGDGLFPIVLLTELQ